MRMKTDSRSSRNSTSTAQYNLKLPLGKSWESFNLATAVCSHGLFMMSPNYWDPNYSTLSRPLRLGPDNTNDPDALVSVDVEISHPKEDSQSLNLRVFGTESLSIKHQQALLDQVKRMLRLSDIEERNVREFRKIYGEADCLKSFDGRVFRSPTLFEDMVKCILLCNCQWPRTLSMARALCELQLELQTTSPSVPSIQAGTVTAKGLGAGDIDFVPKTPVKKSEVSIVSPEKMNHFVETKAISKAVSREGETPFAVLQTGNFPSPSELAALDENLLAKRCKLGYRAGRILKLAQGIVNGNIRLEDKLAEQLRGLEGFGPFTCANVLMCAGFYHIIPTDSETIRHLKQVHGRKSSVQTVQKDVEDMFGKYEPYQFLAFWAELWHFYEQRFGKLSEMPPSQYKLITASNMRSKARGVKKRKIL